MTNSQANKHTKIIFSSFRFAPPLKQYLILYIFNNILLFLSVFLHETGMSECLDKAQKDQLAAGITPQQIYICFCRKQYKSFPALYLHNKTKHDVTIHIKQKQKMKKKVVWSGNKKKVIYQFSSQDQQSQNSQEIGREKQVSANFNTNQERKSKKERPDDEVSEIKLVVGRFIQNFQNSATSKNFRQDARSLFYEFADYATSPEAQVKQSNQNQRRLEILPYLFNGFVQRWEIKQKQHKIIIEQVLQYLASFSKWLFENKYSPYLAVSSKQYDKWASCNPN